MNPGDHLVDVERGQTSYRVEDALEVGERFQIAELYDEEEQRVVVARAILYGDESLDEAGVERRRVGLRRQWRFLEALGGQSLVPEPVDWVEVELSPVEMPPEPLLICEKIDGPTLYEWITDEFPRGMDVDRALELLTSLVAFLEAAHQERWMWRDFDPRRFRIADGQICAVSLGGILEVGEDGDVGEGALNIDYIAPELRDGAPAKMQHPAADLYGAGALLSFLLSGEEPRHRVESPLSYEAYERIEERDIPGVDLLLARLLQPMAEKRLSSAEQLLDYCDVDALPTREDEGFEQCELPAPWLGLDMEDPEKNRGLRSRLSAGPLVSMKREGGQKADPSQKPTPGDEGPGELDWRMVAVVVVATLLIVAVGIIVGA